ncbi:hypothetical protein BDS110ZK25_70410 [Bradyrhizobium diazoefficiens]|nr:hypothetical protein DI395_32035 [Bradyrhizobium diazoefficiens]
MTPAEAVFRAHLAAGRYRSGEAARRWRLVAHAWPHAEFAVRARDGLEYGLRFELHDYPRTPPTARPWDLDLGGPLAANKWPAGQNRVSLAFNPDWKNGACLYLPCDRVSIEGHANWHQQHPSLIWDPVIGIVHYLRVVHDLLNSGDYGGRRAA